MAPSDKSLSAGGHKDVRLQFHNIKANALPNKGLFNKEPYLTFEVEGGITAQTLPAPSAEAPYWQEGVAMMVPAHCKKDLVITVHNKHSILVPDTFVARVVVPLHTIEAGGSLQHYPLHNKKDEQIADLTLEMSITDGTEGGATSQQAGGPDAGAQVPGTSQSQPSAGMSGSGASQINPAAGTTGGTMADPHGPGKTAVQPPIIGLQSTTTTTFDDPSALASAGYTGSGASLINDPVARAPGIMADPHGPGTAPVNAPVVGLSNLVPSASQSGYGSSGATIINRDVGKGAGTMADPHGPGAAPVSSPIVGISPGPLSTGQPGYGASGASIINRDVERGPGIMADPHGPGTAPVNAPVSGVSALPQPASGTPASGTAGFAGSGASVISANAAGSRSMADPHGPGATSVNAPTMMGPEGL